MNERDDIDMLAGEFALGTLTAEERAAVARRRLDDPDLDARILAWEARLAPLNDEAEAVAPSPGLLARIERRLDALETETGAETEPAAEPTPLPADTHHLSLLRRRLGFWRWSAGLASAAALVLGAVLVATPARSPQAPPFVAVFQQDDQQPAFLLSVDLPSRRLHVRPVTAEPLAERAYQLWIKEASLGPAPRSVGVLNDDLTLEAGALRDYDPELLKRATFGISIEPPGGSPTDQPTGPAIHGYLYPTGQDGESRRL